MTTTTTTKTSTIPDGIYFLFSEGSGWQCEIYRNGHIVGLTEESQAETHIAAHDSFAWLGQLDTDQDLDDVSSDIENAVIAGRYAPGRVIVMRVPSD